MLKIQAGLLGYPLRITLKVASGIDYIPLDRPNISDFIPQKSHLLKRYSSMKLVHLYSEFCFHSLNHEILSY